MECLCADIGDGKFSAIGAADSLLSEIDDRRTEFDLWGKYRDSSGICCTREFATKLICQDNFGSNGIASRLRGKAETEG